MTTTPNPANWVIWFLREGSDRKLYATYNMAGEVCNFGPSEGFGTRFTRQAAIYMAERLQDNAPRWRVGFEQLED
jgi:hypothetical protein